MICPPTRFMKAQLTRRRFIQTTAASAAGFWFAGCQTAPTPRKLSANDKLNIGFIGTAGQAGFSIGSLKDHNIVALCDVDEKNLNAAAQKFPSAKTYRDFRRLVEQTDIDAIVVAIPDHTHAVASVAALKSGHHLYCEKPLARTVSETRIVTNLARKMKLVTQIGTQIHAGTNYRRVVELVHSGAIGKVAEVHVWVDSRYGGKEPPKDMPPVPTNLDWDLWLGPANYRPYHPDYVPFNWRNWWAFGGGSLADFGCHYMDLPFWALGLQYPLTVEAEGPSVRPESCPPWLIVRYAFPAREKDGVQLSPVKLIWYHGGKHPGAPLLTDEQYAKWKSGVLFIGDKGQLISPITAAMRFGRKNNLKDLSGRSRSSPIPSDTTRNGSKRSKPEE
jgi:predicted dehydrogenase